jgi:hypothetical protein
MAVKSKKIPKSSDVQNLQSGSEVDLSLPLRLGFVIDRSASMHDLSAELIRCFNAVLAEQTAPNVSASLNLFNHLVKTLADDVPISQVARLDHGNYSPEGNTALLDGIGAMIHQIGHGGGVNARVLVAIFTDGFENSSSKYSLNEVIGMIADAQARGWQFIFITPRPGISYGLRLGIPAEHIIDFDLSAEGLRRILSKLSRAVKAYRLGDRNYALLLNR